MPEQLTPEWMIFFLLYGAGIAANVILGLYMLSPGKAIAPDIPSPVRLRRWTAAFFGAVTLSSIWWFLFYIYSGDIQSVTYILLALLDCLILPPSFAGILLNMLQDRRRPLWPVFAALTPIPVIGILKIIRPDIDPSLHITVYGLMLIVAFTIYMMVCVRQYRSWLRDNYADLEHKEIWLSHLLLAGFMMTFVFYGFTDNYETSILIHFVSFLLYGLLVWRVDTLPLLTAGQTDTDGQTKTEDAPLQPADAIQEPDMAAKKGVSIPANIGQLLAKNCEDKHVYLQHDLSLVNLAAIVGINRTYLSRYFSNQGISYNTYINKLRINHFVALYYKNVTENRPVTIQQLAKESGYRSYSTFSAAFKQFMGQSVASWTQGKN